MATAVLESILRKAPTPYEGFETMPIGQVSAAERP